MPQKKKHPAVIKPESLISSFILLIRGQRVILDNDLAKIYGVRTKALNQAVKRSQGRFPEDFVFRLTPLEMEEVDSLRSQIVTLKNDTVNLRSQNVTSRRGRHRKYLPYVFTEHGAVMAANVLKSPAAVRMSIFVVRAFVRMRSLLGDRKELAVQLAELEKKLTERLDVHEIAIVDVLRRVMELLDPPPPQESKPKLRIGFGVCSSGGIKAGLKSN